MAWWKKLLCTNSHHTANLNFPAKELRVWTVTLFGSTCKGGFVEKAHVYKFSPYSKFEFSRQRTDGQAFVLVFVGKKTKFLTAKHWLS